MKNIPSILASTIIALFAGVLVAHAVPIEPSYVPLAPLPGTVTGAPGAETTTMSTYLSGMLKLIIALGAVASVLMAIIGGTQYVAAGISPSAKQGAMERIQGAVTGLILILVSWLILNSISPNLVNFSLNLPPVGVSPAAGPAVVGVTGGAWPNDTEERGKLVGVSVQRTSSCTTVGQPECTSLAGLGQSAISGLNAIKIACPSCSVVVTAGTEYWLHGNKSTDINSNTTAHKPGRSTVDLSISDANLNTYIRTKGTPISSGCTTGTRFQIGTATYVDEVIAGNPPHWHVCY